MRVTEWSIASTVINNLQDNIRRIGLYQEQLSSGKLISKPSDNPGGAAAAMQSRTDIRRQQQYSSNCTDGAGWLGTIDTTLTSVVEQVIRVRNLALQGLNTGASGVDTREALAMEIEDVRDALIGLANTTYRDRPVFGGTTTGAVAYQPDGTFAGDTGTVLRTIADNTKVRVDVSGEVAFGTGADQLFTVLEALATAVRSAPETINLDSVDHSLQLLRTAQSNVGARYNQVTNAQQTADDRVLDLRSQLSNIEDIDLPKTITDLKLRQTAYEAALAAAAKVVQPSLVDFLS
ncbi:MAG: flagellar hook-associated protein FlgL [Micromonosporaceae bacterium]|nr:flagellar hook-associated protein FlgL [Micromonosporaceae bacterium]